MTQVNVNLAGLPALVLPCGFVEGGPVGLPVGLQMIGAAFDEVLLLFFYFLQLFFRQSSSKEIKEMAHHEE